MMKLFSQAVEMIRAHAKEDGYPQGEINRLLRYVEELRFDKIRNWFLIWDALGSAEIKNAETEALYSFAGLVFEKTAAKHARKSGILPGQIAYDEEVPPPSLSLETIVPLSQ